MVAKITGFKVVSRHQKTNNNNAIMNNTKTNTDKHVILPTVQSLPILDQFFWSELGFPDRCKEEGSVGLA